MTSTRADRDDAAFYHEQAAEAFARGSVCWGLYFLDAADFYAEPTPEQASARIGMLLGAMDTIAERTGR